MLDLIILFLILVGLVLHRYLTTFWEQKMLPYSMGFLTFANLFALIYLINFVWIFGFIVGVAIFLLTFLQVVYASFLWPFLLPQLINVYKKPIIPKVNLFIYGSWPCLVIGLGLLTIVNFFVSDYALLTKSIVEFFGGRYMTPTLWIVGIMILSNIIRIYTLSKYLEKDDEKKQEPKNFEFKEAMEILDEAEDKFEADFGVVREYVEKGLDANKEQFLELVQKSGSVRKYIYTVIANISGDMVESGQYHIYRGVLNPMGPGEGLLKIFDGAMDELVKLGDTDAKNAEKQKKAIRENIKNIG